jgi:hypothetical protein
LATGGGTAVTSLGLALSGQRGDVKLGSWLGALSSLRSLEVNCHEHGNLRVDAGLHQLTALRRLRLGSSKLLEMQNARLPQLLTSLKLAVGAEGDTRPLPKVKLSCSSGCSPCLFTGYQTCMASSARLCAAT